MSVIPGIKYTPKKRKPQLQAHSWIFVTQTIGRGAPRPLRPAGTAAGPVYHDNHQMYAACILNCATNIYIFPSRTHHYVVRTTASIFLSLRRLSVAVRCAVQGVAFQRQRQHARVRLTVPGASRRHARGQGLPHHATGGLRYIIR